MDRYIEGARLPRDVEPATGKSPISGDGALEKGPINPLGNSPIPDQGEGEVEKWEFKFVPAVEERFLAYAEQAPRSKTDMLKRGPLRHSGAAAAYVDHLAEQGRLRWVQGPRTKPR